MITYQCDRCRRESVERGLIPAIPSTWRWHKATLLCGRCAGEMDSILLNSDFWESGEV